MMADDCRSSGICISKTTIHDHLYRAELNVVYPRWIRGATFEIHLRFAAKFAREQRNSHGCKITGGNKPALCDDLALGVLLSFGKFYFRRIVRRYAGQFSGGRCPFHAWDAPQLLDGPVDSLRKSFPVARFRVGTANAKGQTASHVRP